MSSLRQMYGLGRLSVSAGLGMARYLFVGEADHRAWRSFLGLHCNTNGLSTEILARAMRRLRPPRRPIEPFRSMFGDFDSAKIGAIADQIRRDGYHVFETRLPAALCDQIADAAKAIEARAGRNPDGEAVTVMAKFDPDHPIAYVYDVPEDKVCRIRGYQQIMADPIFVNVSQAYFGASPALKNVNLWWSAVIDGKPDSHAAQLFHFDFDAAPRWLKFFVYLSDVSSETGPHVYVRGSHRRQAKTRDLLARGYVRIDDDEIASVFGRDNIVELSGLKGTVLAVDTMGFHKGKPPSSGYRLLAQLEYAIPLFVASKSSPQPIPPDAYPGLLEARKSYPWAFARFPIAA